MKRQPTGKRLLRKDLTKNRRIIRKQGRCMQVVTDLFARGFPFPYLPNESANPTQLSEEEQKRRSDITDDLLNKYSETWKRLANL